jgi:GNAT superfamily N-acetyltransferase
VIDRVYVDERCRDIGCGDALLAHAIDTARRQGCAFIEGEALPGDRETKNLFERAGVTARRIIVSKGL